MLLEPIEALYCSAAPSAGPAPSPCSLPATFGRRRWHGVSKGADMTECAECGKLRCGVLTGEGGLSSTRITHRGKQTYRLSLSEGDPARALMGRGQNLGNGPVLYAAMPPR